MDCGMLAEMSIVMIDRALNTVIPLADVEGGPETESVKVFTNAFKLLRKSMTIKKKFKALSTADLLASIIFACLRGKTDGSWAVE